MNVNFLVNSYNKLLEDEKASLLETANDLLHFIESFAKHEKQNLVHLRLLEDPIQDINTNTCRPFQTFFHENFFFQIVIVY